MIRAIRHIIRYLFPTTQTGQPVPPTMYSSHRARVSPGLIRITRFDQVRRGYDPEAVHQFLNRIADDLAAIQHEAAMTQTEADRIRTHLRKWQSDHAATCRTGNVSTRRATTPATWITQPSYQSAHSR